MERLFIMVSNSSLDLLASNGIIDFDANAFVKGTPPKFFGTPNNQNGVQAYGVTPGAKLNSEPVQDAFVKREKEHTPPNWLSLLTGSIVSVLGVFGIVKAKNFFDNIKAKGATASNGSTSLFSIIKGNLTKIKDNITSFVKPKNAPNNTGNASNATTTVKAVAEKVGFWAKHPKLKVTGVGALAALGLYGLYEVVAKPKPHNAQEH